MSILDKLQKQPEYIRKIILWGIIIIAGLGLGIWWMYNSYQKMQGFQREEFIEGVNLPSLEEELEKLPKIEMPEIDEEKLEELKKEIEKTKDATGESQGEKEQ